jgi:hypothetical protein
MSLPSLISWKVKWPQELTPIIWNVRLGRMEEATTHELGVDESDSCGFNTHPLDYSSYLDLRPCVKPELHCLTVAKLLISWVTPLFYHVQLGLGQLIVNKCYTWLWFTGLSHYWIKESQLFSLVWRECSTFVLLLSWFIWDQLGNTHVFYALGAKSRHSLPGSKYYLQWNHEMLDSQPMCNHVVELIFTTLEAQRASYTKDTFVIECNFSLKLVTLIIIYHCIGLLRMRHTPPYKLVTDFVDSKLALFGVLLGGAKLSRVGRVMVLRIDWPLGPTRVIILVIWSPWASYIVPTPS